MGFLSEKKRCPYKGAPFLAKSKKINKNKIGRKQDVPVYCNPNFLIQTNSI